ncbi:MAG TPA: GGDEF domain-containing protein [Candidatus Eremiobacteraceae bacterium]|nr:GGDEF domain-containing protein [Candidatus Eremiobacteraceae bacterium]
MPHLSKIWILALVFLTAVQSVAFALLPRGLARAAFSDIVCALLMLSVLIVTSLNGISSKGRMRVFWILQATGWGLWLTDQLLWIVFDLVLQKQMPVMFSADALLFMSGVPILASLLLRPHLQPSARSARLGALDFSLLLLWWLYLYVFYVICWQYVCRDLAHYDRNYNLLVAGEALVLAFVLGVFWYQASGQWRKFYGYFLEAVLFNSVAFYLLNRELDKGVYYTGSWYDLPYSASFAAFTVVALAGQGLSSTTETSADETYASWIAALAMMAVLSLPVIAGFTLLGHDIPASVARFRVLVTLGIMFAMVFLIFFRHYRLNEELKRTNNVLQEVSLTDPLTCLRNRRYFLATIEGDVNHVLRCYEDNRDQLTRDLVFYLIDADNFKEVNDRYGHDVGDRVLVEMARRISSAIRHSDVLVRWGGEEFLILSRYTDRGEAKTLSARVLAAVSGTPFALTNPDETICRTCSIGWAAFPWLSEHPEIVNYEKVLNFADRALGEAKRAGKNRAVGLLPAGDQLVPTVSDMVYAGYITADVLPIVGTTGQQQE